MELYTCLKSRGLRVSWLAEELGLALDHKMLPFPPRIMAPDYINANPLGTVPMLVDGDIVLTESSAILFYLASRFGSTDLAVGSHEADFGPMHDYLHHADATLTFPQTVYMRFVMFEKDRSLEAAGEAYAKWFAARLVKIDRRLTERKYLCEDRFTIADIAIGYALYLTTLNGLCERVPANLKRYLDLLKARPAFQRAIEKESAAAVAQGVS